MTFASAITIPTASAVIAGQRQDERGAEQRGNQAERFGLGLGDRLGEPVFGARIGLAVLDELLDQLADRPLGGSRGLIRRLEHQSSRRHRPWRVAVLTSRAIDKADDRGSGEREAGAVADELAGVVDQLVGIFFGERVCGIVDRRGGAARIIAIFRAEPFFDPRGGLTDQLGDVAERFG